MDAALQEKAAQAAQSLLIRNHARSSMAGFSEYIAPDFPPAAHHKLLCDALDDVMEGRLNRLMVFFPPGAAKSTYCSINFPSYYLGQYPKKSIICASAGMELATSFGRKVRNMVLGKEYGNLFSTKLSEDSRAKGEWETNEGGSYFACGVGSNVVGRRGDLGLIDDPVKSREEADSMTSRDRTWEWYRADFFTRLKPGAAQIIIQTRWHEDDLSGRILPDTWDGESGDIEGFDGQIWKVICLPAQARENDPLGREVGEWLWPEWFTNWEEIRKVQTAVDMRNWNALYQQTPQPNTGVFFKREWFKRYKLGDEPALTLYGASDYAVTDGAGDFTEHGVAGFDKDEDLYFIDWWSGQTSPDIWFQSQFKLVKKHKITLWVAEVGSIRRAVEPFLKKAKREQKVYFRNEWMSHIGDKAANSRSFQALAADGKVFIPRCEWGDELINQLVKFIPNTNFRDDKVDVCGLLGRILDKTYGPTSQPKVEPKKRDEYGFDDADVSGWKTA